MEFQFIEQIELFILLALIAEILGTIGGFGSSIFFVPIAGMFLDFQSVLGVTALFHLSSNMSKITLFRKGFDKNLILQIGIPSVVFAIMGAYFSKYVSGNVLQLILSCILILFSLVLLGRPALKLKPSMGNVIAGGSLSGLMAGLLGTGGAIRGLTMGAFKLEKSVFIATSAVVDLGVDLSRSAVYFGNGFIHTHDLHLIPLLFVVSFVGTFIGKKLLAKFSEKQFQKTVLIMVLTTGLFTIGQLVFF